MLWQPDLREHWSGWQVRRPLLEGDPRRLLRQLQEGRPQLMLSTVFETGIGLSEYRLTVLNSVFIASKSRDCLFNCPE